MKSSHAGQDFMLITIGLFFTTNINGVFTATQLTTSLVSTKNRKKKYWKTGNFFSPGKWEPCCIVLENLLWNFLFFIFRWTLVQPRHCRCEPPDDSTRVTRVLAPGGVRAARETKVCMLDSVDHN